jgi:arylsulfatase A-like enzyme
VTGDRPGSTDGPADGATDGPDVDNVVLVTADSLRADAVGADDRRTPEIGAMMESGLVFENAYATGNWTPFSFPAMLGGRPVFAESGEIGLHSTPSLPEVLSDAGVATGGFNAANGFLTEHWGYDRGFDEFESFVRAGDTAYSRYLAAHPTVQAWLRLATSPFRRVASRLRRGDDTKPFTDTSHLLDVEHRAVDFLGDPDEPFFLWVHYMDTHTPYVPAPRHLREVSDGRVGTHRILVAHAKTGLGWEVSDRTLDDLELLYDGTVRQVDASVGRLRGAVEEAGVADDTAMVVAGDHGEEFMEHGHLAHYPKLYDELVNVPLVVDVPGGPSGTVERPVGLDALPPTVCDLLGVDPADAWVGESLFADDLFRAPDDERDEPVVSVAVRGDSVTQQPIPRARADGDLLASARTARWAYVENTASGERELYDRQADPEMQEDLFEADRPAPGVVDRLARAVEAHVAGLGDGSVEREDVDEDLATQLGALGYR